jgi:hypothetical protein
MPIVAANEVSFAALPHYFVRSAGRSKMESGRMRTIFEEESHALA